MSTNLSFSCRLHCNLLCLIVVIGNRTTPVVFGTHDNMVSKRSYDSPQTPEGRQQTWGNLWRLDLILRSYSESYLCRWCTSVGMVLSLQICQLYAGLLPCSTKRYTCIMKTILSTNAMIWAHNDIGYESMYLILRFTNQKAVDLAS